MDPLKGVAELLVYEVLSATSDRYRMQAQAFCLYFRLTTLEQYAARLGFTSGDWREQVLQDLLHDGKLKVERRSDPRTNDVIYWCYGRKAAVQCHVDHERADTLFVLGLFPGPEAPQGRSPTGPTISGPGPWRVATLRPQTTPPPIGVGDHLDAVFQVPRRVPSSATPPRSISGPPRQIPSNAGSGRPPAKSLPVTILRPASAPAQATQRAPLRPGTPTSPTSTRMPVPLLKPAQPRGVPLPTAPQTTATAASQPETVLPVAPPSTGPLASGLPAASPQGLAPPAPPVPSNRPAPVPPGLASQDLVLLPQPAPAGPAAPPPGDTTSALSTALAEPEPLTDDAPRLGEQWRRWWRRAVVARTPALAGILDEPDPQAARRARIETLSQEIARLREALEALPSIEAVDELERGGQEVQSLGERSNIAPPDELLGVPEVAADLLSIYCSRRIDHVPAWALDDHPSAGAWLRATLTNESTVATMRDVSEWIRTTFGDAAPESLLELPSCESDGSPVQRLDVAWRAARERESLLNEIVPHARDALVALPRTIFAPACERVIAWQRLLHPEAMKTMVAALNDEEFASWLKTTELPPEAHTLTGDDLDNVRDLRDFKRALRMIRLARPPASTPQITTARLLGFDHGVTDAAGKIVAAALCLPELKPGDEVGTLHVPIRLRATAPYTGPLTLEISAPHLRSMPQTEYTPGGSIVHHDHHGVFHWQLKERPDAWYESEVPGEFYLDTIVPIPVYRQALLGWQRSPRSELNLIVRADGNERRLNFARLHPQPRLTQTSDNQASPADLVTRRPLGAQVVYERLADIVRRGGPSFMVVAPRRFGKTTLLKYLAGIAEEQPEVFSVIVDLGRHMSAEDGLLQLFKQIGDRLHQAFGAAPALPVNATWAPQHFREVRQFLRTKGTMTLAIFVDEAQVLVPRQAGLAWGNTFKNMLEHHLTGQRDSLADVVFGLFGTIDLSVKVGRNCRDFLFTHGYQAHEFDVPSLNRYLREVGQGHIESTSAARIELAHWANNLWTLGAVLQRILRRINIEQRTFFVTGDVRAAVDELLKDERDDTSVLWGYASAELSYSDEWEPIDAFPLAVAWARDPGAQAPSDMLDASVRWLNEQLARLEFPTTITRDRLEMCLADLKSRGIVRESGEFRRPLLRELLRRQPVELFAAPINTHALSRLAVDVVEWPADVEYHTAGGQARIYSYRSGDTNLAYRASRLESADDRRRFTRMCAAIRKIREARTRQDGDENLPRIRQAGYRADNPSEGVLIYDWVQGQSLESAWDTMPARARVRVTWQIARALAALHSRNAIHCDVRPGNIIVDGNMHAVLVDFGLVRQHDGYHRTRLADDPFVAPELQQDPPQYSSRADIYSLGVFLRGHDAADAAEWRPLLDRMLARDPAERPAAVEVAATLHDISSRQGFDPRREEAAREIDAVIERATDMWLMEVLLPYRDAAALCRCGYLRWDTHRATEIAFYLGNIFSHMLRHAATDEARALAELVDGDTSLLAFHGQLTRTSPRPRIAAPWCSREVKVVGKLRNAWAHQTARKTLLQEIQSEARLSNGQMLAHCANCLRAVAQKIDRVGASDGIIEHFVDFFVSPATT